jgi:tetratricopeptide (TPR) repeat protein
MQHANPNNQRRQIMLASEVPMMETVRFADWERQLIQYRRDRSWDEAHTLLRPLLADDKARGWAQAQMALTLYAQASDYLPESLRLIDDALLALDPTSLWSLKAALNGMMFADRANDTARQDSYAVAIRRFCDNETAEIAAWRGRIASALGAYSERRGRVTAAVALLRQAVQFYTHNIGPFNERDRRAQTVMALVSLGDLETDRNCHVQARRYYEQAIRTFKGDNEQTMISFVRGRMAVLDGNTALAIECYREAIQSQGHHMHRGVLRKAIEALAEVYRSQGMTEGLSVDIEPFVAVAVRERLYRLAMRLGFLCKGKGKGVGGWRSDWLCCLVSCY